MDPQWSFFTKVPCTRFRSTNSDPDMSQCKSLGKLQTQQREIPAQGCLYSGLLKTKQQTALLGIQGIWEPNAGGTGANEQQQLGPLISFQIRAYDILPSGHC